MSVLGRWYFKMCALPLKAMVRVKSLPEKPIEALEIATEKPVYYVMRTRATSSFIMLKEQCKALGLPEPQYIPSNAQNIPNGGVFFTQHKQIFGLKHRTIKKYSELFKRLLNQHKENLDQAQLIPVSLYWGRNPGKEKSLMRLVFTDTESANPFRKFLILLYQGRNSFMQFGAKLDLTQLGNESSEVATVRKLIRLLRVYFHKQRLASMGPLLANRKELITGLLARDEVIDAIQREQKKKKISAKKARDLAYKYADEIASSYSYKMVRFLSTILTWLWNKIYGGIEIKNVERVQKIAQTHELVYLPCHRSHIDYLLLSYSLYYEGLVPPHIAAGINLNFWPIGSFLRRGGAFFIRRSFSGNKLYTAVFNAYFHQLLDRGIPVEFFPEGGRSRTGRLLQPKTGMLSMMVQNYMKGCKKPIAIIPVYVGYEKMMEGKNYVSEMQGGAKQKESMGQLLKVRTQLQQRYGKVYVNFAEPIDLAAWLDNKKSDWRDYRNEERPQWMSPVISELGQEVLTRINQGAAVNCINLTSLILLATQRHTLGKQELLHQISSYLELLKALPNSKQLIIPTGNANQLLEDAKQHGAVNEFSHPLGNLIQLEEKSAILLTYYRNNIIHLFALPALIACCFRTQKQLTEQEIVSRCSDIFPLLKTELFLPYNCESISEEIKNHLAILTKLGFINTDDTNFSRPEKDSEEFLQLMLLADVLKETLERYGITLTLLATHAGKKSISRAQLETQSQQLSQRISALFNIYAPEAFDKALFQQIVSTLRETGLIENKEGNVIDVTPKLICLHKSVMNLLSPQTQESLLHTAHWAEHRWLH